MYRKVLIANRGEIACRIGRTLRRMGVAAATVHSSADFDALHVREIGESVWIGEGPARQSYLDVEAILRAAKTSESDAIHPGFGFLSENPTLARRCADLGLAFIGPDPETLELFGDKAAAKNLARELGIPTAGGMTQASDEVECVLRAIGEMALPCMVKAVAGGGGKGMRVIHDPGTARAAVEAAIREGRSSFGDGRVIVERYLTQPRHIEVQILGDGQGGVIHLYDRECSLQRRHQKVVEEAPVISIPDYLRQQLWRHSLALGQTVKHRGLATVEFAVTQDSVVFLEVNPRLQVEHPVTECVLGLDLIELQIRTVADGRLAILQEQVPVPNGHAIQARLYAEDAAQGFLPSTGRIDVFRVGPGVRADVGVNDGSEISPHYDPMIAKLIAHDSTRGRALGRLREALRRTIVLGVTSNRGFLLDLLDTPQVVGNQIHTETIDQWLHQFGPPVVRPYQVAALMAIWRERSRQAGPLLGAWSDAPLTGWRMQRRCRDDFSESSIPPRYEASTPFGRWRIGFGATKSDGSWPVRIDDEVVAVTIHHAHSDGRVLLTSCGRTLDVMATYQPLKVCADVAGELIALDIRSVDATGSGSGGNHAGSVLAPLMGMVAAVHVELGQRVAKGDPLATLESMKMEMPVSAMADGVVNWIGCDVGGKVERNQEIFRLSETA